MAERPTLRLATNDGRVKTLVVEVQPNADNVFCWSFEANQRCVRYPTPPGDAKKKGKEQRFLPIA